jgi:hypothetical protein
MAIEKAFLIEAEPAAIWEALWAELAEGDPDRFEVEGSNWPHSLVLRVDMAGIPSIVTYRIKQKLEHSEVSATLEPIGARYLFYQILTFGRLRTNYELMLVQGLSNLKAAVEGTAETSS